MKAKEVILDVKKALDTTKQSGAVSISIDAMTNYMTQLEKRIESVGELNRLEHEASLKEFEAANARSIAYSQNATIHQVEMFKSVIASGQTALKSSMIINGGAAAALLAFTGKIWIEGSNALVTNALTSSIFMFCIGILAAAFATGTTYLAQFSYGNEWIKTGNTINIVSVLSVLFSYGIFIYSCYNASSSFALHFGTL
ncbi:MULTISPECIES: hypothetical protein [Vibrio]|uniref:Uncharacterized protein n=1 Tax=Vibrio crassostreae TaxID=246167 RepID=A0A1J0AJP2_9VIBR|nr:hypothetical protein [Vibrio crassostreae]APB61958.1 conserved membrane protein of unknown function [Vibrio crassostreae]TCT45857.1 hypothetical protein EDB42_12513 [Vibrio crassostreae]TCT69949.1 hypothetical protein EDB41_12545 [Vibrio crassostreae]TCT90062.1 hypothetical protein EDB38_12345 [Vibrio crassostreae]CAK2015994.1 conserved membrane hypothetical protein [Vibrio crassostreae]